MSLTAEEIQLIKDAIALDPKFLVNTGLGLSESNGIPGGQFTGKLGNTKLGKSLNKFGLRSGMQSFNKAMPGINAGMSAVTSLVGNYSKGTYNPKAGTRVAANVLNTVGDAVSAIPVIGNIASMALKGIGLITGGLTDSVNKEYVKSVGKNLSQLANTVSNATDVASVNSELNNLSKMDVGKLKDFGDIGFLSSGRRVKRAYNTAKEAANISFDTALNNIFNRATNINISNTMNELLNFAAFGGNLGTNSSNWSTGLTHIDTGSTHEKNPYEGVPMGADREGTPNLVELGETIFDDYVFSDRLIVPRFKGKRVAYGKRNMKAEGGKLDSSSKAKVPTWEDKLLKKYGGFTFSAAAKKIEHDMGVDERPNDWIARQGMYAYLQALMNVQELERAKKQLRKGGDLKGARELNKLSGYEYALMKAEEEARKEQEAMAQQLADQLQLLQMMAQQLGMDPQQQLMMAQLQMDPNQQAMMLQLMMAQLGMPLQAACGGRLNRYAEGGQIGLQELDLFMELIGQQQGEQYILIYNLYQTLKRQNPKLAYAMAADLYNQVYQSLAQLALYAEGGDMQEEQLLEPLEEMQEPQERKDPSEMTNKELNEAIKKIIEYALNTGDEQLEARAEKVKNASREKKEEFVEEAISLIEEEQAAVQLQELASAVEPSAVAQLQLMDPQLLAMMQQQMQQLISLEQAQGQPMMANGGNLAKKTKVDYNKWMVDTFENAEDEQSKKIYNQYLLYINSSLSQEALEYAAAVYQYMLEQLVDKLAEGGELEEEPTQEQPAEEQELTPEFLSIEDPSELSTKDLNKAIDLIIQYAKENKMRDLTRAARKAKRGSREDKEDFIEDAIDEVTEFEELKALEQQSELQQLATPEEEIAVLQQLTSEEEMALQQAMQEQMMQLLMMQQQGAAPADAGNELEAGMQLQLLEAPMFAFGGNIKKNKLYDAGPLAAPIVDPNAIVQNNKLDGQSTTLEQAITKHEYYFGKAIENYLNGEIAAIKQLLAKGDISGANARRAQLVLNWNKVNDAYYKIKGVSDKAGIKALQTAFNDLGLNVPLNEILAGLTDLVRANGSAYNSDDFLDGWYGVVTANRFLSVPEQVENALELLGIDYSTWEENANYLHRLVASEDPLSAYTLPIKVPTQAYLDYQKLPIAERSRTPFNGDKYMNISDWVNDPSSPLYKKGSPIDWDALDPDDRKALIDELGLVPSRKSIDDGILYEYKKGNTPLGSRTTTSTEKPKAGTNNTYSVYDPVTGKTNLIPVSTFGDLSPEDYMLKAGYSLRGSATPKYLLGDDGNPLTDKAGVPILARDENGNIIMEFVYEPRQNNSGMKYKKAPSWPFWADIGLNAAAAIHNIVNKADLTYPREYLNNLRSRVSASRESLPDVKYIGDFLKYHPAPIMHQTDIRTAALNRALDAITNQANGNVGALMQGSLAAHQLYQQGLNEDYIGDLKYNTEDYDRVDIFNRKTNLINADAYNARELAKYLGNLEIDKSIADGEAWAYKLMNDNDAARATAIAGNISGIANSLHQLANNETTNSWVYEGNKAGLYGTGIRFSKDGGFIKTPRLGLQHIMYN